MYAGGKYSAGADNYEYSLGLNGLGPVSYTHLTGGPGASGW